MKESPADGAAARRSPQRGFTLIEVMVALFVLAVALLAGTALVLQQPRVVRRLDAERQVVRALESTLESMRAGLVSARSQELVGFAEAPPDLRVVVVVASEPAPGLYQVSLLARYSVLGEAKQRRLDSLLWRPGGP